MKPGDPIQHEFTPHPETKDGWTALCQHHIYYKGNFVQCAQPESHEWHQLTHCQECDDTGIIWRQSYPDKESLEACPDCEEGQLMKEFL